MLWEEPNYKLVVFLCHIMRTELNQEYLRSRISISCTVKSVEDYSILVTNIYNIWEKSHADPFICLSALCIVWSKLGGATNPLMAISWLTKSGKQSRNNISILLNMSEFVQQQGQLPHTKTMSTLCTFIVELTRARAGSMTTHTHLPPAAATLTTIINKCKVVLPQKCNIVAMVQHIRTIFVHMVGTAEQRRACLFSALHTSVTWEIVMTFSACHNASTTSQPGALKRKGTLITPHEKSSRIRLGLDL